MKINRKTNACDLQKETQIPEDVEPVLGEAAAAGSYDEACDYIMKAIRSLAEHSDDAIAQDSIANLSVVLFDLQGGN